MQSDRERRETRGRCRDLGFNRSTVFGWIAAHRKGGVEALTVKPVPGRPSKLTKAQLSVLFTMIEGSNPAQFQLDFALWTRDLVRQAIAKRFGVDLSVGSVGRILRGIGLSPQRPLHRATQQDPERVARWKAEEYPAIYEAKPPGSAAPCTSPMRPVFAPITTAARHGLRSDGPPSCGPPAPDTRST
jgi:transposase